MYNRLKNFPVNVVHYYRPHGRKKDEVTLLPIDYKAKYDEMLKRELNFSAEVLVNEMVSVTIESSSADLTIRVVKNGPKVQEALIAMLEELFPEIQ